MLFYLSLFLVFFSLVELIQHWISNYIIASGELVLYSSERLFEMTNGRKLMSWIACWSSSHHVKYFVSFLLCSFEHLSFEKVIPSYIASFPVGGSVEIDDGFFFFVKEVDASAHYRSVGCFNEHEFPCSLA